MKTMIYKPGGITNVWGTMATVKTVDSGEVGEYVKQGWLDHPSKLFEKPKRSRLAKAETDADINEG